FAHCCNDARLWRFAGCSGLPAFLPSSQLRTSLRRRSCPEKGSGMTDVATPTTERPTAEEPEWKPGRGPIDWLGGGRVCWSGGLAFIALALAIRIFQQFTAWSIGIDASSRDFGLYYRALFIA